MGIYFGANPTKLQSSWDWFVECLKDRTTFWIAVGLVAAYLLSWWLTSLQPTSRHDKIKQGLLHWYNLCVESEQSAKRVATDNEAKKLFLLVDQEQNDAYNWIIKNMSPAAGCKFVANHGASFSYSWVGEHDPLLVRQRDSCIDTLTARAANIQDMMNYDSWDGPEPSLWFKLKKATSRGQRPNQL